MEELLQRLKNEFTDYFQSDNPAVYFAPGRVNLIGDHTDYTGGYVMPFAIDCGTYVLAKPNDSSQCRLVSLNFEHEITSVSMIDYDKPTGHWTDYLRGIISEFSKLGITFSEGIDALVYGNIPNGSGLSSSASLEIALILALTDCNGYDIPQAGSDGMIRYVQIAQGCENNYIGVKSGIMDQFIVANAKPDTAIKLNCHNLDFEYIPLKLPYDILVMNTMHKRTLKESKYNERYDECLRAMECLKRLGCKKEYLGAVTLQEWAQYKDKLNQIDEVICRRVQHVVTENHRVNALAQSLQQAQYDQVAKYINESQHSLDRDYEVSGEFLNAITAAAGETSGVVARRMTGAGFGGCAVALVELGKTDRAIENIGSIYTLKTHICGEFYKFRVGGGARKI